MANRLAIVFLAGAAALAGCARAVAPAAAPDRARGIVSLDYCADQYVLKLVGRDRILALSPDAGAPFSYMRKAAAGVPRVRPLAENVLVLQPDLVVRSYGGGPNAAQFFERAGVPVVQIGFPGDIEAVRAAVLAVAEALGEAERGKTLVLEMDARLAALQIGPGDRNALYMTPGGVTAGPGTLVHEMLAAAGLANFQSVSGWRALPLERLAYERPDMVAAAFFDSNAGALDAWSAGRHPLARRQMAERPTVFLEGAWTSCGGWFVLDAIEALAADKPEAAR